MMGKVNFSTSSTSKMRYRSITSFGGSTLLSICPGFAVN
jgi:hypothetical protein